MPINEYFRKLNEQFKTGIATEHTYRGASTNLHLTETARLMQEIDVVGVE